MAVGASSSFTVAFGSCRKQRRDQSVLWRSITNLQPDVFLWLGDYIYPPIPRPTPHNLSSYYADAAIAESPLLQNSNIIVDGVYDDHDYGINDGGRHWVHRDAARSLFLDRVVKAPSTSARRTQAGGLYGARMLAHDQIKLVMLDTRYARDDHYIPSPGGWQHVPKAGYLAGCLRAACALLGIGRTHEGDLLGSEEQWQWLEKELTNSTAKAHLIVSSVQVLTSSPIVESWGHFPRSKDRLLRLLERTRPRGAVFLSGDVHYAELLGVGDGGISSLPGGSGVLEVTSSGLTHSCGDGKIGWLLCGTILRLFDGHRYISAGAKEETNGKGPLKVGASLGAINFGSIAFHFEDGEDAATTTPHMEVRIHDVNGAVQLTHALPLNLPPEVEAARWAAARQTLPDIYEGAAVLRGPLSACGLMAGAFAVLALKFYGASNGRRPLPRKWRGKAKAKRA